MSYRHIAILFVCLTSLSVSHGQELLDRIVAVVENETVTERELFENVSRARQMLARQNKPEPEQQVLVSQVLQQVITRKLQLQEADRLGIRIDEISIDRALAAMAKNNDLTLTELKRKIEQSQDSFEAIRNNVREDLTIKQVVQREVIDSMEVSEQEINDFIIAKSQALNESLAYRFAHLKLPKVTDNRSFQSIIQRIHKTLNKENITNFSLLKKRTADLWQELNSKKDDNLKTLPKYHLAELDWKTLEELPKPVRTRLASISAGQQIPPIANSQGLHLFHLLAVHSGDQSVMLKKYHIRHILMQTTPIDDDAIIEQKLNAMKGRLQRNGDFKKFAKKYSQDPGSAFKGGDLGWNDVKTFDPKFAEAALAAYKIGGIFGPFKSEFGWHLLEVLGVREDNITDQATRNLAINRIRQARLNDEIRLWLLKLREEKHIQVFI